MAAYIKFILLALCLWMAVVSGLPQQYFPLPVPQQAQQSPSSGGLNPPSSKARDFWDESQLQDASEIAQRLPTQVQELPKQFFAQAQKTPAQYVAQAQEFPGKFSSRSSRQIQSLRQNSFLAQPGRSNSQAVVPKPDSELLPPSLPQPLYTLNSGNI